MTQALMRNANKGESPRADSLAIDLREAGRLLGVGMGTIDGLCRSGQLVAIQIGRSRRVLRSSLQDFVAERLKAAKSA